MDYKGIYVLIESEPERVPPHTFILSTVASKLVYSSQMNT